MIKLYQFPAAWGLPNPSPYCMKLEVYMRLAEIPYEIVTWQDPRKAPKGKLPMIEHDGHRLPDSEFALHFLAERATVDLDGHLSPAERATGYAVQKMLDEGFYWTGVYSRWVDDRVWPTIKKQFFGHMPPVLRDILPAMIRRKVKRDRRSISWPINTCGPSPIYWATSPISWGRSRRASMPRSTPSSPTPSSRPSIRSCGRVPAPTPTWWLTASA
jgi:hypothetical protein